MSITVQCRRCGDELSEPGALLFSPPDRMDEVVKIHLCGSCYAATLAFIEYLCVFEESTFSKRVSKFIDAAVDAIPSFRMEK
jgi:hypothetical protein